MKTTPAENCHILLKETTQKICMEVINRTEHRIEFKVTVADDWFEATSYCKANIPRLEQFSEALDLLISWDKLNYEFIALYSNFELNIAMLPKTKQYTISGQLARDFLKYEEYVTFDFVVQPTSLKQFRDTVKNVLSTSV